MNARDTPRRLVSDFRSPSSDLRQNERSEFTGLIEANDGCRSWMPDITGVGPVDNKPLQSAMCERGDKVNDVWNVRHS